MQQLSQSRIRPAGAAGLLYVFVAAAAAALPGAPPTADGQAATYRDYFIAHHTALAVQGWLYALAAPLLLVFAAGIRHTLRAADDTGFLGDLFIAGTTVVAALLIVSMSIQVVFTQFAGRLDPDTVYAVGAHVPGMVIVLSGPALALTAAVYAYGGLRHGAMPRWTAYLAILVTVVALVATCGVFVDRGAFSVEGGFSAWGPAASMLLWYLGTSIALLRLTGERGHKPSRS